MLSVCSISTTVKLFIVYLFCFVCIHTNAQQSVWKFKPRSISFIENGKTSTTVVEEKHRGANNIQNKTLANCPTNIDFELGNFSNWECFTGLITSNTGVVNMNGAAPPVVNRHTIIPSTSTVNDIYGGFPIKCPNGSGYSVRLGNSNTGRETERIRYTFTIPPGQNDFSIIYYYAVVFNDNGHPAIQQPRFQAKVYDAATGNGLGCATYDYTAAANLPGFLNSPLAANNSPVRYKSWTPVTVSLSGLAGKTMILEFTSGDCSQGGHFGYAYVDVDASCNGITVNGAEYCSGANSITLTGPPGYQNYNWYNFDYSISYGTGQTITISPAPTTNSILNVALFPFAGFGCNDTVTTTLTAHQKPVAGFTVDTIPICLGGNNFSFTNTSTVTDTSTLSYVWKFGDAGTSTSLNPNHTYAAAGNYTVKLITSSASNCNDSTTKTVYVIPNPSATFDITSLQAQCFSNNNFTFNNTSPAYAAPVGYTWYFGDGGSSTTNPAAHSYTTAGNYNVKLVVSQTSNNVCKDSITKVIAVEPAPTTAFDFYGSSKQCLKGNLIKFKNNSTTAGTPLTYLWYFGDGNTSSQAEPQYSYITAGTFTVKLIAFGAAGCKDSITHTVTIDVMPTASFAIAGGNRQCQDGNLFSFVNNSTLAATLNWNFGDGTTSTLLAPQHTYINAGTYTVTMIGTSINGCSDTTTRQVIVENKPTPNFTITGGNEQCVRGNNFNFLNTTTVPIGTFTQSWHFGDGSLPSALLNPFHSYNSVGSYTIKLIITTDKGCIDSISKTINTNPNPVAAFSINDTAQCLRGNNFSFTNNSTIATGTNTYTWNFGDATTSTQQSPIKNYSTYNASYPVQLIASSNKSCNDTITKNIRLYQHPVAVFTIASNVQQCEKSNLYQFSNASVFPSTLAYQWSFGDGNSSTQSNAVHQYAAFSNYTVSLVAASIEKGCTDTVQKTVEVYKNPGASFAVNNLLQCLRGNNFVFSNAPIGTTYQYNWSFGDGSIDNTISPTHMYATVNNYNARLIVDNIATPILTCSDTATKIVSIRPDAVGVIFNKGTHIICEDDSIALNAGGGVTYQWYFNSNANAITSATAATYKALREGFYTVDVTNQFGCTSTSPDTAFVVERKKPQPDFIWDSYCINKSIQFSNSTNVGANNAANYTWHFGDSATSILPAPLHAYTNAKIYTIKLIAASTLCPYHIISKLKTVRVETPPLPVRYTNLHGVVGNSYTLNARNIGAVYTWLPVIDLTAANTRTPILKPTGERNFTVKITTPSGCQTTDSLKVLIFKESDILVPKAFTPNNDGLNDVLYPILVGIKEFKFMRIYNRWGNLVFTTNNEKMGWNGESKSQQQPTETYTWVAEAIDDNGNLIRRGGNTILIR